MNITYTRPPREPDFAVTGVVEHGGGRYDFTVWRTGDQWYAAFPDYHACSKIGSTLNHRADYIAEKMGVPMPDAEVMADIINRAISASRLDQAISASRPPSMSDFLGQILNG